MRCPSGASLRRGPPAYPPAQSAAGTCGTHGRARPVFPSSPCNAAPSGTRRRISDQATQTSLFGETPTGETSQNGVKAPSLDELLAFYDQSWIDDWYLDGKQKADYYKTGKDILRAFYNSEKDNWTIPVAMEGWFKIKVGEYLVHGRIDRIDKLPDGTLEIIDYKTGKSKTSVEGEDKDQLLIYQIAVNQLPEYNREGKAGRLTYFYLNDNTKVSFLGTDKEIDKLKDKMITTISEIKSGNFQATPSPQVCKSCDFRNICQFRA